MDILVDVLIDSVKDTAQLVPFLLVTYLAMEALEHVGSGRMQEMISRSGAAGPVVGSMLGAVPQCGFSAMAATLFAGRVVTIGTLIAVILSTSDEMIPVFIAHQAPLGQILAIIGAKAIVGLAAGVLIDLIVRALGRGGDGKLHIHELCEREHCRCSDGFEPDGSGHGHDGHLHDHRGRPHHGRGFSGIVRSALYHTVQITLFIFCVSLVFGLIIESVGHENLVAILGSHPTSAIFLAGLIGLIPNCGASVAIADLFMEGVLASGPMMSGLLASGGVGLLVLFRTNADLRQNLAITVIVYAVAVLVGLAVASFGIIF